MEYRQLGSSGLRVPALSFGTGTFGGQGPLFSAWGTSDAAEARRLIDISLDAGVTLFDTADVYSNGASEAILGEAGRLAAEELAPLNHDGDRQGCVLEAGAVTTPKGFKEFYRKYRENGWNAVPFSPEFGGQGLPWSVAFGVQEMWQSANMGFGLCPLLNQGSIEALEVHGTDAQKETYLARMISGEWTGTMNLTEPQAGSDLALLKTKAVRQEDGTYLITGQKIFITYGEHDFTDNIIHFVLARTPDAPEGTKGISLFIVPKFIPDENGNPGIRNDVKCTGIEHKVGIHASPTCTMQYGDKGGATGYLVGKENEGLKCMFTMMNNARLSVGLQGVAIAERAYQHARAYAFDRRQGNAIDKETAAKFPGTVAIVHHPDVKRMLLTMKALTEAARGLAYEAAYYADLGQGGDAAAKARVDLMTPIVKSWCTDRACEVASLGVQIHGGMGFIEETGAGQYYRDVRILTIYEGTNGIQALDLHGRKVLRDQGAAAQAYSAEMKKTAGSLSGELAPAGEALAQGLSSLEKATAHLVALNDMARGAAVNTAYLDLFGTVAGAESLLRAARVAQGRRKEGAGESGDAAFYEAKVKTALFYAEHILPRHTAYAQIVLGAASAVADFNADLFHAA